MMPIIRPLPKQCQPQTEYQNERLIFAEMKADLRRRKRQERLTLFYATMRSFGYILPKGVKKLRDA
ncbi:MAG: hypothetical protein AAFP85_05710 [Pseudomonadota bacterium]